MWTSIDSWLLGHSNTGWLLNVYEVSLAFNAIPLFVRLLNAMLCTQWEKQVTMIVHLLTTGALFQFLVIIFGWLVCFAVALGSLESFHGYNAQSLHSGTSRAIHDLVWVRAQHAPLFV